MGKQGGTTREKIVSGQSSVAQIAEIVQIVEIV
jgi:hypothetical protein